MVHSCKGVTIMKHKTCCFTGHRVIPCDEVSKIQEKTKNAVIALINKGVIFFGVGGARGFDTIAAEIILELKKQFPHIKLILILPCAEQTKGWSKYEINKYQDILKKADKIRLLSSFYYNGCMHVRNRHMVNHSAYCICYCRKTIGGTAYTRNYAIQKGLEMIEI